MVGVWGRTAGLRETPADALRMPLLTPGCGRSGGLCGCLFHHLELLERPWAVQFGDVVFFLPFHTAVLHGVKKN